MDVSTYSLSLFADWKTSILWGNHRNIMGISWESKMNDDLSKKNGGTRIM